MAHRPRNHVNNYQSLEKFLGLAGASLVVLAVVMSMYSLVANSAFGGMGGLTPLYYARYGLIMVAGFAIGYSLVTIAARHRKTPEGLALFNGSAYALLALVLFFVLDYARLALQVGVGYLEYPWGRLLFEGMPLLAIFATLAIYYVLRVSRTSTLASTKPFWVVFTVAFLLWQLVTFWQASITIFGAAQWDVVTLLFTMIAIVLTPIGVAAIAYWVFRGVADRGHRIFYAVYVGTFYYALMQFVWLMNMPHHGPWVAAAPIIAQALIVLVTTALLIFSRRLTKPVRKKKRAKIQQ